MDAVINVWKPYVFDATCDYYLMQATATGVVVDGVEMVKHGTHLCPIIDGWHLSQTEAKRAAAAQMAVLIGKAQAKLDTLRDEMLHEDLTTEEAAA